MDAGPSIRVLCRGTEQHGPDRDASFRLRDDLDYRDRDRRGLDDGAALADSDLTCNCWPGSRVLYRIGRRLRWALGSRPGAGFTRGLRGALWWLALDTCAATFVVRDVRRGAGVLCLHGCRCATIHGCRRASILDAFGVA